jgi:hypothetical protein
MLWAHQRGKEAAETWLKARELQNVVENKVETKEIFRGGEV